MPTWPPWLVDCALGCSLCTNGCIIPRVLWFRLLCICFSSFAAINYSFFSVENAGNLTHHNSKVNNLLNRWGQVIRHQYIMINADWFLIMYSLDNFTFFFSKLSWSLPICTAWSRLGKQSKWRFLVIQNLFSILFDVGNHKDSTQSPPSGLVIIISQNSSKSMEPEPSSSSSSMIPSSSSSVRGASSSPISPLRVSVVM